MPDMETTEKKRITLRSLWRLCPARHAVLLISLAWLAAYFLLRENRAVMNFLCKALVRPWHAFAGRLFSAVPFSVTEWVILFLAALGVVLLVLLIVQLIRRRWVKAYRTGMTILSVSAAMFALFCLWWGVLYYSDSFTEQAGLEQRARKDVGGNYGLLTWMTPTRSTQSYMLHQGTKFAERFDANSYIRIADMWAEFDIRDHTPDGTFQTALEGFRRAGIPALIFSIDTDCCFRPAEQQDFAAQLEAAHIPTEFHTIASTKGHDSFLLEPELYAEPIRRILAARKPKGTA